MDREKVIKAWEIFRDSNPFQICNGKEFRSFKDPDYFMGKMIEDTITLLKEQEAVEPYVDFDGHDVWRCGKCGTTIFHVYHNDSDEDAKNYAKFCRHCGQAVKWK